MTLGKLQTHRFFGMKVHALSREDLLSVIESAIESDANNCVVGNHNLHSLYLLHHDATMGRFQNICHYIYVDGISVILLAKFLGIPLRLEHRTAALDWYGEFFQDAEKRQWRVYILGGRPEVAAALPARMKELYPQLELKVHHGYDAFDPNTQIYKEIEEFKPHILLVGMGMPLQEKWISESLGRVKVNLITPIGATMDYIMGVQSPAPRWMGKIGLEWLYRLVHDPRRLFSRYLIEPLALLPLLRKKQYRGGSITKAEHYSE